MAIKRCPHCGSEQFQAKIIRAAKIQSKEDGTFDVLTETQQFTLEIVKCNNCKETITNEDLVEAVPCKECGKPTAPALLDSNGVCDVCQALHVRPELANASKEDIIRMLLKMESGTTPTAQAIDTKLEKANETSSVAQSKVEAAKQAMAAASHATTAPAPSPEPVKEENVEVPEQTGNTEQVKEPAKTTRKKRGVKKQTATDEQTEDTTDESTEAPVETPEQQPIPDFMNLPVDPEQAPFPQQEEALQQAFEQPETPQATAPSQGEGFTLFDEGSAF